MENFSPLKLPNLTDPEMKAVHNAAQLASYHLADPLASCEAVQRSVNEAFKLSLEALEKKGRLLRASEQRTKLLLEELSSLKNQVQQLKEKVETLEVSSAFYADEKEDAVTQTEEEPAGEEEENMSWADDN